MIKYRDTRERAVCFSNRSQRFIILFPIYILGRDEERSIESVSLRAFFERQAELASLKTLGKKRYSYRLPLISNSIETLDLKERERERDYLFEASIIFRRLPKEVNQTSFERTCKLNCCFLPIER